MAKITEANKPLRMKACSASPRSLTTGKKPTAAQQAGAGFWVPQYQVTHGRDHSSRHPDAASTNTSPTCFQELGMGDVYLPMLEVS